MSDVIADLILGKEVAGRICEGRFLWETTTKLLTVAQNRRTGQDSGSSGKTTSSRLEQFGLLHEDSGESQPPTQSPITAWIWHILQGIYLGYVALRFIVTGLFRVASSPGPGASHGASVSFPAATPETQKEGIESSSDGVACKRPVLDYRLSSMASQLLGISERMPWLTGLFALVRHLILAGPGKLGDTDSVLDRYVYISFLLYLYKPGVFVLPLCTPLMARASRDRMNSGRWSNGAISELRSTRVKCHPVRVMVGWRSVLPAYCIDHLI